MGGFKSTHLKGNVAVFILYIRAKFRSATKDGTKHSVKEPQQVLSRQIVHNAVGSLPLAKNALHSPTSLLRPNESYVFLGTEGDNWASLSSCNPLVVPSLKKGESPPNTGSDLVPTSSSGERRT